MRGGDSVVFEKGNKSRGAGGGGEGRRGEAGAHKRARAKRFTVKP